MSVLCPDQSININDDPFYPEDVEPIDFSELSHLPPVDEVTDDIDETGAHEITLEEYDEHIRRFEESEGFDIVNIPNCYAFGIIMELNPIESVLRRYKPFAMLAIDYYNRKNNTHFEVNGVEKVNKQCMRHDTLYITFQATDKNAAVDDAASSTKTFQARVVDDVSGYLSGSQKPEIIVELCRLKPTIKPAGDSSKDGESTNP